MSNTIDENKLREAKEKLACHIQPPNAHAVSAGSSCGTSYVPQAGEKVKLTQMTTAGG